MINHLCIKSNDNEKFKNWLSKTISTWTWNFEHARSPEHHQNIWDFISRWKKSTFNSPRILSKMYWTNIWMQKYSVLSMKLQKEWDTFIHKKLFIAISNLQISWFLQMERSKFVTFEFQNWFNLISQFHQHKEALSYNE